MLMSRFAASLRQLVPFPSSSRPLRAQHRGRQRRRAARVESLEVRQLLTGDFAWVQTIGSAGIQSVDDLTTDSSGNLYSAGQFEGAVDFDPGSGTTVLTAQGSGFDAADGFVMKSNSLGALTWVRGFHGDRCTVSGVAVANDGSVIVTGDFYGTVDFNPGSGVTSRTSAGSNDMFVVKLTSAGSLAWVHTFGDESAQSGQSVAVDSEGGIYVAGVFSGTVDFDSGTGVETRSQNDPGAYLLALGSNASFHWVQADPRGNLRTRVSVQSERVVLAHQSSLFSSSNGVVDGHDLNVWVLNRSSGGSIAYREFESTGYLNLAGAEIEQDGSVVIVGSLFTGQGSGETATLFLGAQSLTVTQAGGPETFFLRLNSAGGVAQVVSTSGSGITSIALSGNGDLLVAGLVSTAFDADPGVSVEAIGNGTSDHFVAVYSPGFDLRWVRATSGDVELNSGSSASGVVELPDGTIVAAGSFNDTTNFDSQGFVNRTSVGGTDIFLWALSPNLRFDVGDALMTGDVLLKRNGNKVEVWFNGTFTFGQYVLRESGFLSGIRSLIVTDNSNANSLTVDYQSGGGFAVPGGVHFTGVGNNDTVKVLGVGNEGLTWSPGTPTVNSGRLTAWNGSVVLSAVPAISATGFQHLFVEPQGSTDVITVSPVSGVAKAVIGGTTNGTAVTPLTFDNVRDLTIDTEKNDGLIAQSNDTVTFNAGSYEAQGLKNVFVRTGKGNDTLAVIGPDIGLPVADGRFWFIGGSGSDRLTAIGDTNWDLNDARLVSAGGGRILLDDIEQSSITGGASKNHLNASLFSGDVILDGGAHDNLLRGGSGNDLINGGTGNDRMFGGLGDDTLQGQDGNDQLWGEAGDDTLRGGNHNDRLFGGDDNDFLQGDAGNDLLDSGRGDDGLNGGGGLDLYDLQGTNNAEDLQLVRVSASSASFRRKPRGLSSILEQDSITMDAIDEFLISALDGDDLITIDALFTQLGSVDGGNGADTCTAPAAWTKVSC